MLTSFYGYMVYEIKRIVVKPYLHDHFKGSPSKYTRVGYSINTMRQSACLVITLITVYRFEFLVDCTTVGQISDSIIGGCLMLSEAKPNVAHRDFFL